MKIPKVNISEKRLPKKVRALKPFEYKVIESEKGRIVLLRCKCNTLLQIPSDIVSFTLMKKMTCSKSIECPKCGWKATIYKDEAKYME